MAWGMRIPEGEGAAAVALGAGAAEGCRRGIVSDMAMVVAVVVVVVVESERVVR